MGFPIATLVTGHSAVAVTQLAHELAAQPGLLVGTATTFSQLRKQIEVLQPRVILLDGEWVGDELPALVGDLRCTRNIATLLRCEAGRVSSEILLDAMEAGALGVFNKPASGTQRAEMLPALIWNIRAAALANLSSHLAADFPVMESVGASSMFAIGAGLGALNAMSRILTQLPADAPGGVAIVPLPLQLMQPWVDRINARCQISLRLANDADAVRPGQMLIAPGDKHVLLKRSAQGLFLSVKTGPAVFHQRPSIEVLFNSVADIAGCDAVGVLLGSAGVDGVAGLMHLRNAGGRTIGECQQSAVIAEAPARAEKCRAVEAMVPANKIAAMMMEFAARTTSRAA